MSTRASGHLGKLLALAFLAVGWWFLAPGPLGGKTSYAVTSGISMEPHFHAGDLVLLRGESEYHVGDIVGYHSYQLHRQVMHRIVRIQGNHFYFKGDNNGYIDPEHPVRAQLFGKEWLRLPGVGGFLEKFHSPRNASILAGLAALFVLAGGGASARRRRRHHRPPAAAMPPTAVNLAAPRLPYAAPPGQPAARPFRSTPAPRPSRLPALALTLAAGGLAAVTALSILGAIAYSRPLQRVVTQSDLYTQHGQFDYSADVPVGAVYDHSPLTNGDAVFFKLVNGVDLGFNYTISTKEAASFSGQAKLDAIVTDGLGWKRRLSLEPLTSFRGNTVSLKGYLDLVALRGLIDRFQARTGAESAQYGLLLKPWVKIDGAVGGNFVHEQYQPQLQFDITADRMRVSSGAGLQNGFNRTQSGTGSSKTPRQLSGLSMGVAQARHFAKIGIPAALLIAILGGLLFVLARNNDEVADIRRRYGPWMIDVAPTDRSPHLERRVESVDALSRIAERYERLILHEQRDRMHSYLVEDDGIVYRYDAYEKQAWRSAGSAPEAVPVPGGAHHGAGDEG